MDEPFAIDATADFKKSMYRGELDETSVRSLRFQEA